MKDFEAWFPTALPWHEFITFSFFTMGWADALGYCSNLSSLSLSKETQSSALSRALGSSGQFLRLKALILFLIVLCSGCSYSTRQDAAADPSQFASGEELDRFISVHRELAQANPVDPMASEATIETLRVIQQIGKDRPEIVVGQNIGEVRTPTIEMESLLRQIQSLSGDYRHIAMVGVDYGWGGADRDGIKRVNRLLIEHARRGGLITINFDPGNPRTGGEDPNEIVQVDLRRVRTPGTLENSRFTEQLDIVAEGLKELQQAGVVVLWRPIHEPNGGWFWWCSCSEEDGTWTSPEEYRKLWKYIYQRFTEHYQLHNLLWVYSPAATVNDSVRPSDLYYPGEEFVDIVGIDLYIDQFDRSTLDALGGFSRLRSLGKPLAFCEIGSLKRDGKFDAMLCLEAMCQHTPDARYMLFWHSWGEAKERSRVAIPDSYNGGRMLRDQRVIMLPRKSNGALQSGRVSPRLPPHIESSAEIGFR